MATQPEVRCKFDRMRKKVKHVRPQEDFVTKHHCALTHIRALAHAHAPSLALHFSLDRLGGIGEPGEEPGRSP